MRAFWASAGLVAYTYAGFPAILWLRSRLAARPYIGGDITPPVSIIIAAYNEEATIRQRLENLAALDYPPENIEVVVASDGSTDGTDEIVRSFDGVRLLSLPRGGKAAALNAAVPTTSHEILVFSDANTVFARDALRALVRPFADPRVGGVAGDQRYEAPMDAGEQGEQAYWNLDRTLKVWESAAGSVVQATGAIYAIRRTLFRPIPGGVSDDFVTSVGVIAQGYRLVFAPDAVAYEPVAPSTGAEFRRKVRIGTRMLRSELHARRLLNPLRHGFYAIQLFSHKPLRRLMAFPLVVIAASNLVLRNTTGFYRFSLMTQLAFYGLALLGLLSPAGIARSRLVTLPAYFCMTYAAQLVAVWNLVRRRAITGWNREGIR